MSGQNTSVSGTVLDAKTNEPLPFANIILKGFKAGVQSDFSGKFQLSVPGNADTLLISCLSYTSQRIGIKKGTANTLKIELLPSSTTLNEVTLKFKSRVKHVKDTTALLVYHHVVNNKSLNRPENQTNYSYNQYVKMELDLINFSEKTQKSKLFRPFKYAFQQQDTMEDGRRFIPALIREKVSDVYYRKLPEARKEIVRASRLSGIDNESVSSLADYQFDEIDAYANIQVIMGRSFIMPFANTATATYWYFLEDTMVVNGRVSYNLKFAPANKEDLAFTGSAWIDSATWAITSVDMYPNEKANLNFVTDYRIKQRYGLIDHHKGWFLDDEKIQAVVTVYDNSKQLSAWVKKSLSRKDAQFDISFPKNFFLGDPVVIEDSSKLRNEAYWSNSRHLELTEKESKIYEVVDSVKNTKAYKRYYALTYWAGSAYFNAGPVEFGRFYQWFSRNALEGYRAKFGFRTNHDFSNKVQFEGYGAYGFKDKDWKYYGAFKYMFPRKNGKWNMFEIYYKKDVTILGLENPLITHDNVLNILRRHPLRRVMLLREANISYEKEWVKGFTSTMAYSRRSYYGKDGFIAFYKVDEAGEVQRVPSFVVSEFSIKNRIGIKEKYWESMFRRQFINTKYPVINFNYSVGIKGFLGGNYTYHRFDLEIKQRLSSPIGFTKYTIRGGKIFGTAPFPLLYLTAGNLSFLYDKFNYNMLREFEFVSDEYVSVWVDHHFDGLLFNKIPLLKKLKLRELITFKGLIGHLDKRNRDVMQLPNDLGVPFPIPYIEAGFGIENIAKVVRVDFLWRLTYRNKPGSPNFGVRVMFQPSF